jgi:TonB family protein
MLRQDTTTPEVFTAREIARAAGTGTADAEALLASGLVSLRDAGLVDTREAVRAVLLLQGRRTGPGVPAPLFGPRRQSGRRGALPLTASGLLHALAFALALVTTLGVTSRDAAEQPATPSRLVFLVAPGPGGGGGGGGLRQPAPARPARLEGKSALKSPIPIERAVRRPDPEPPRPKPLPPPVEPAPKPVEPPPPVAKPDPVPPVVAPVASGAADARDRTGDLVQPRPQDSLGPGNGGGAGAGSGTGLGAGTGAGIGDGSGAGTGGGPYRPGSGIDAPELLREVKPEYTEEARRRSLTGDVVLEIVVRADGRVGSMKVVRGLGAGLDQRATDAVRQWLFKPARRRGTPVDVVVEVAVEFRLR